jgi:signal transduction histidine kinase
VYSDAAQLVGTIYPERDDELAALPDGVAEAEITDLSAPENRFETGFGKLLEVYLPLRTGRGDRVLFEAYYRYDAVADAGWSNWLTLAPVSLGGLLALELVLLPLAWQMARRLQQREEERARLLRSAIDASDAERRRIASYLHDGVVQDLAGVSYALAAAADRVDDSPEVAEAVRGAADQTRQGVRALRSLLVEIYPPTLHGAGLESAINDLVAPLSARGIAVDLDLGPLPADPALQTIVFRVAQESLRNVVSHAGAASVRLALSTDNGLVHLRVHDDGRGFPSSGAVPEGHFGLRLLHDLARDAGGTLDLSESPLGGARVDLQVPAQ